ncbi:NAD(P)/FAD-dependent oxidoreductase [Aquisalimonas sp.]|uniref:FAD-dependent oxidoreductase n=1 Tax=Aquisalimonas sp. TaxID=1872621 RepID=UPI0025BD20EF|nr:NAD(P)/FAD-dependent oxidoreductase [Aquisalimonas sp.]
MTATRANTGANWMPRALVVGGGIAGPAVALFLKRIGVEVTVFEARSAYEEEGGGLSLTPNGLNVLQELGLAEQVLALGARVPEIAFRRANGELLTRYRNGRIEDHGMPSVALARARLHRVLLEALHREGISTEYGRSLEAVSHEGDGVAVRFEDGTWVHGDFVVGADGTHSRTRRFVLGGAPVSEYTGVVAVGGFLPVGASVLSEARERAAINITLGSSGSFGYCNTHPDGERWAWWSRIARSEIPGRAELASLMRGPLARELREMHGDWHEPIPTLLRNTSELLATPIHEIPTLPRWWRGRIVLVGDAVHAMSPHAGVGASIALEDALYLAMKLREEAAVAKGRSFAPQAAFERYEVGRRGRAEAAVRHGRRSAPGLKPLGPVSTWLRDRALGLVLSKVGERSLDWLYGYRLPWSEAPVHHRAGLSVRPAHPPPAGRA